MVKALVTNSSVFGFDQSAAAGYYTGIAGFPFVFNDSTTDDTTAQVVVRTTGAFSKLYVRLGSNAIVGTTTLRFRKNGANGNGVVSIGSVTSGEFVDSANIADTAVAGDKVAVRFTPGDTINVFNLQIVSALFEADNGNALTKFAAWINSTQAVSTTYYYNINGIVEVPPQAVEASQKLRMQVGGTFKNAGIYVPNSGITNASTYTFRKNGAASTMTISLTGSTTGFFEDTAHSVSVVSGDDVCNQIVTGSAGTNITYFYSWVEFEDTTSLPRQGTCVHMCGAETNGTEGAVSHPVYYAISGSRRFSDQSDETLATMTTRYDATFKNLSCLIVTNSLATSTMVFRVDSIDGYNTVSIPTNTTGYFADTTDTDNTISTSHVNYKFVSGAGVDIKFGYIHILSIPKEAQNYITFR